MAKRYVLGLMASNRTGILAAVTKALGELGGDLDEASVTVMHGFFTIILTADFPETHSTDVISNHIRGVCSAFGADVMIKDPSDEPPEELGSHPTRRYMLTLLADDAPGLLARITGRLALESIDITDFYAVRRRPHEPVFMLLELQIPTPCDCSRLHRDLEQLGAENRLRATLATEEEVAASSGARTVRGFARHVLETA